LKKEIQKKLLNFRARYSKSAALQTKNLQKLVFTAQLPCLTFSI